MKQKRAIGFEIKAISNIIRRELNTTFSSPEFGGLTGTQNAMMGYIMDASKEQDVFQRDVEKEFDVRRSTATVMLQGLEQKGYICRLPVEQDARLKKIVVTEKAQKQQERVRHEIDLFHEKMEKGFTEEEREQLFYLLNKIKKNLE